jgi:tRNA(Ile)-lysidine synthase TilS/MesJ
VKDDAKIVTDEELTVNAACLEQENSMLKEADVNQAPGRCRTCVLPRSLAMVDFDPHNTCQYCRDTKSQSAMATYTSQELANQQVEVIQRIGDKRPYDALLGLSGGRDSSYMAYLLRHQHNLRLLGAHYRTPFTPERTIANVKRLVQSLDIPLMDIPISRDFHIEVARAFFLRWHKDPRPVYASLCCAVCKLVNRYVFLLAKEQNIGSIVYAGNPFERAQFLAQDTQTVARHSFSSQLRRMITIFRIGLKNVLRCPPSLFPISFRASVLYINPHTPYLRLRYSKIRTIEYFHYAPWTEADCNRVIKDKIGWQPDPGDADTWKADCDFSAVKNYMFLKMHGATYNDALYSNLIRSGQIDRSEAISRIRAGAGLSVDAITRAMERLDLPTTLIDWKTVERAREI